MLIFVMNDLHVAHQRGSGHLDALSDIGAAQKRGKKIRGCDVMLMVPAGSPDSGAQSVAKITERPCRGLDFGFVLRRN
jgi:hypothetical protein